MCGAKCPIPGFEDCNSQVPGHGALRGDPHSYQNGYGIYEHFWYDTQPAVAPEVQVYLSPNSNVIMTTPGSLGHFVPVVFNPPLRLWIRQDCGAVFCDAQGVIRPFTGPHPGAAVPPPALPPPAPSPASPVILASPPCVMHAESKDPPPAKPYNYEIDEWDLLPDADERPWWQQR